MLLPKVLILSGIYDFSTDEICWKLKESNISFIRINSEQMNEYSINFDPIEKELCIKNHAIEAKITNNNLHAVFFRRPVFLRNTPSTPLNIEEQLSKSQWTAFLRSLSLFTKALWVNYPQATYLAESKPYQISIANSIGFKIPKTFVVNNLNFDLDGDFIVKSLDTVLLKENGNCFFAYTNITNKKELSSYELSSSPFFVQEFIKDKEDIRVTVVGNDVYSHKIVSDKEIIGDWRKIEKDNLFYHEFEIDSKIKKKCIELNKKLGLNFSAIDFVKTKNDLFFLEVNPTGEWGFLDNNEASISSSIERLLIGRDE